MTDATRPDLEAIKARANLATPGPWTFYGGDVWYGDVADALTRMDTAWSDDEPEDHWPYKDGQEPHPFHGDPVSTPDAEFIAHAREDIPYLVAELVGLRAQRDAALAMCQAARVAQSAPMWTPSRGAIAGFALNVEAALGVQPAPDKEQK